MINYHYILKVHAQNVWKYSSSFLVFSSAFRKKYNKKKKTCLDLWFVGVTELFFYYVRLEKEALFNSHIFPSREIFMDFFIK